MRVFFFCDSTMNILTSYFISKVYYDDEKIEKILLISNNSANSIKCVEGAIATKIWSRIEVIEEYGKNESELEECAKKYIISERDIFHVFALQNNFARAFYTFAGRAKAKIIITDEGVILFNDFLDWPKKHPKDAFVNIDVKNRLLEAWVYEPKLFQLPSNINVKAIELSLALHNPKEKRKMKLDIKKIFNISEFPLPQIIYFDTYLTLQGRTTPQVEKFLLQQLIRICNKYEFYVKRHPMERNFISKFDSFEVKFLESSTAPWEAVYFVNCVCENKKGKSILISYESTSLLNSYLMFKDEQLEIIILKNIIDKIVKTSSAFDAQKYFFDFRCVFEDEIRQLFMPTSFSELERHLVYELEEKQILVEGSEIENREKNEIIDFLSNDCLNNIKNQIFLSENRLIFYRDNEIINIQAQEYIIDGSMDFLMEYVVPKKICNQYNKVLWTPIGKDLLLLHISKCTAFNIEGEKIIIDTKNILPNVKANIRENGWIEFEHHDPQCIINNLPAEIQKIRIEGEWMHDFDRNHIFISMESELISYTTKVNAEYTEISKKHEELSEKYKELSEKYKELSEKHEELSGKYQVLENESYSIKKTIIRKIEKRSN